MTDTEVAMNVPDIERTNRWVRSIVTCCVSIDPSKWIGDTTDCGVCSRLLVELSVHSPVAHTHYCSAVPCLSFSHSWPENLASKNSRPLSVQRISLDLGFVSQFHLTFACSVLVWFWRWEKSPGGSTGHRVAWPPPSFYSISICHPLALNHIKISVDRS